MLEQIYYNNTVESWLISAGIIVIALIINWIITIINRRYLKTIAKRTQTQLDNILINTLESPLKVGVLLVAIWVAFSRLETSEAFDNRLQKAYAILIVLNVTWFFAHLAGGLIVEYLERRNNTETTGRKRIRVDTHLVSLVRKFSLFVIWTIGIVTALSNVGYDIKAVLGTLGIGGIAFALAAQDTVKNIFGGFTILLDGTFRIGDRIRIGEFEGMVEDIGVRSTKIRNYDRRIITLSNYKILEDAVMNISSAPKRRIIANLGVEYNTSIEKMHEALELLETIARENNAVSDEGILAVFENFGDFSLNIRFCYFLKDATDMFETPSVMNLEILKRFNEAGIVFAFPTQTLHFANETKLSLQREG